MRCSKSNSKREVYSKRSLPQEMRKISNKQPDFIPKQTRKNNQKPPKVSRVKEIVKIRLK